MFKILSGQIRSLCNKGRLAYVFAYTHYLIGLLALHFGIEFDVIAVL